MQAFCIHIDTIQDSLLPRIFEEKVLGKAQNNYLARLLLILSLTTQTPVVSRATSASTNKEFASAMFRPCSLVLKPDEMEPLMLVSFAEVAFRGWETTSVEESPVLTFSSPVVVMLTMELVLVLTKEVVVVLTKEVVLVLVPECKFNLLPSPFTLATIDVPGPRKSRLRPLGLHTVFSLLCSLMERSPVVRPVDIF